MLSSFLVSRRDLVNTLLILSPNLLLVDTCSESGCDGPNRFYHRVCNKHEVSCVNRIFCFKFFIAFTVTSSQKKIKKAKKTF